MTQMRKTLYAILIAGSLVFSGCSLSQMAKMAKDQQLTVTPNPLEVHADTVSYEMSAVLPVKMLKKGKVYTVNNFYKYGDQEMALEGVEFKADDYPDAADSQPRESRTFSFPYDPSMKQGELMVQGVASDPRNGKFKESEKMAVAKGVITTSQLVTDVYYAAYAPHGYNNQEELIPTNVDFFFQQGSSVLRTSEKRSDRGKSFDAFIAEKNVTRTVTITGTHSPEGSETINTNLAGDRAAAIEKFYRRQMARYDYQGMADSINFILKPVVRDWSAYKDALKDYDGITDEQKSEITNIVNGAGTFEEKEKQLQKLSSYKKTFRDIYPDLRTAKTEVLTVKEKKTDAEIAVLAKQITEGTVTADTLSDEELSYAATLTPSLQEKEAIYTAATKKNDSWQSHNNLGAVYLEMAMADESARTSYVDKAKTQFELSNKKQQNAEATINMGVVYAMEGNTQAAWDALSSAEGMSPKSDDVAGLKGVKGVQEIKYAKYDAAVSTLSGASDEAKNLYNKGLAQLLKKDFQNALASFNDAIAKDGDLAIAHYGAAIASARMKNSEEAIEHLGHAVSKDPSLKEAALTDLEFDGINIQDALK